jgi:hypothetical protein
VTRLGELSPLGKIFNLEVFAKIIEVANIFAIFFPWKKLCINFYKEQVGPHFGQFFHKLFRSPWRQSREHGSKSNFVDVESEK